MADNKDLIVICPACGKEMEKVYMSEAGVYLDVCTNGCGGIYFDNREYKKFDEKHEDIKELEEALKGKTFEPVDQTKIRVCPMCGTNMVKNYASVKCNVEIDECYNCGSKFLDCGELEKIRDEYVNEHERIEDALKDAAKVLSGKKAIMGEFEGVSEEFGNHNEEYAKMQMRGKSVISKVTDWLFNK